MSTSYAERLALCRLVDFQFPGRSIVEEAAAGGNELALAGLEAHLGFGPPEAAKRLRLETAMSRAWAIAQAHSHAWACANTLEETLSLDKQAMDQWTSEQCPFAYAGRFFTLQDVTGTGRCRWEVALDGHTAIEISRPSGRLLRLEVAPDGSSWVELDERAYFEMAERHLWALLYCTDALRDVCGLDLEPALRIVRAAVRTDEERYQAEAIERHVDLSYDRAEWEGVSL